ncbi:MAG TPA: hypothetical protein VJ044_14320, partial [Candidatus Hodarchaeales archaeon]|nr:hypothetical protein [Candidatus Hodarchaeales archaeon]
MLKPKEYILDPETNRIFQVVVIRLTGTKPRIMMRDLRTQKITEEVFSPRKQFLRIVPENPKYTLTYYQENRLYVLNVDTFEELELDGSGFVNLAELKAGFDAGRTVVIQIEKIEDIKRIISFEATVEAVAKAPQPRETSPPPLTQATSARTKSRDEAQLALSSSAKLDSGKAIAKSNFGTSTEKGKNLSKSVPANAKRPQAES